MSRLRVAVLLVLAATACTRAAEPVVPSGAPGPARSSATPPPSSRTPRTSPAAGSGGIQTVLSLPAWVSDVASGENGVVYASYRKPHTSGSRQVVVRFDPRSGSTTESVPIPGGNGGTSRLALADGYLWAAGGTRSKAGSSRVLCRLDGSTLTVLERLTMPAPPTALAAVAAGLWVAAGNRLLLLDPSTGSVRRVVTVEGDVETLVSDPGGQRLYVETDASVGREHVLLLELDAGSGAVLASFRPYGDKDFGGLSGLSATDAGVWVTAPTGMMAQLVFLRASDLRQTALFKRGGPGGMRAYVAGGSLWVTDIGGYWCADPVSGRVLGHVGREDSYGTSDVIAVPSGLYVGGWNALQRITPARSCG